MTTIRTTEQSAPDTLRQQIPNLLAFLNLTTNQPTTAELEEALVLLPKLRSELEEATPCLVRILREWISSRHLIAANAHRVHPDFTNLIAAYRPKEIA